MDIKQIKRDCGDCRKVSRWAEVRSDFDSTKFTAYRIVSVGAKYCRVMSANGTVFNVKPEDVRKVW